MLKYLRESLVCTMYTEIKRCNDIFVAFSQELRSLLSYFPGNFLCSRSSFCWRSTYLRDCRVPTMIPHRSTSKLNIRVSICNGRWARDVLSDWFGIRPASRQFAMYKAVLPLSGKLTITPYRVFFSTLAVANRRADNGERREKRGD